jgi:hypothetical protein
VTTTTVLLLVVLWAAVLVPGAWRDRRSSPRSTVDGFHAAMARLATCDSRRVLVHGGGGQREVYPRPDLRQLLLERRRMVLARLLGLVGTTFLTALVAGGAVWWGLFWVATVACVGYVATLRAAVVRREQTRDVVRLHPAHKARLAARRMLEEFAQASGDRARAADAARAADHMEPLLPVEPSERRTADTFTASATARTVARPTATEVEGLPWTADELFDDALPYAVGQGR